MKMLHCRWKRDCWKKLPCKWKQDWWKNRSVSGSGIDEVKKDANINGRSTI